MFGDTAIDNIFSIEEPNACLCTVWSYVKGHRVLEIRVRRPGIPKEYQITFVFVQFFSGPLSWRGANFKVSPPDDSLAMLKKLEILKSRESPNDDVVHKLTKTFKLYTASALEPNLEVIILAARAEITEA